MLYGVHNSMESWNICQGFCSIRAYSEARYIMSRLVVTCWWGRSDNEGEDWLLVVIWEGKKMKSLTIYAQSCLLVVHLQDVSWCFIENDNVLLQLKKKKQEKAQATTSKPATKQITSDTRKLTPAKEDGKGVKRKQNFSEDSDSVRKKAKFSAIFANNPAIPHVERYVMLCSHSACRFQWIYTGHAWVDTWV